MQKIVRENVYKVFGSLSKQTSLFVSPILPPLSLVLGFAQSTSFELSAKHEVETRAPRESQNKRACSHTTPSQEWSDPKLHTDDEALWRSMWCLGLVAWKFKTEQQLIRDTTWFSVELHAHHKHGILGVEFQTLGQRKNWAHKDRLFRIGVQVF